MAEQTEEDQAAFVEQQKKIAKFSKYIEDNTIDGLGILKPTTQMQHEEPLELTPMTTKDYKNESTALLPSAEERAYADI